MSKNITITTDNVLFWNAGMYLLGVKTISSHAHNTGSWYPLVVLSKISNEHPQGFLYESSPTLGSGFSNKLLIPVYASKKRGRE